MMFNYKVLGKHDNLVKFTAMQRNWINYSKRVSSNSQRMTI